MRAIEIYRSAELTDLIVADQALPSPAPHQVLIKVVAAGVNRPDLMQRKGLYPPPPGASPVLGLEVAGTITKLGSQVKHLKIGEPVCALLTGGGYAEYCLASACCCLPIPQGLSFIQASALPETFFTVWSNVFDYAKLQVGETLLVHGGTSGIGTTALQLGKAFGAQVIVTAGNEDKCQYCEKLGADLAINYRQQDFVEALMHQTDGKGVNVVLDIIGGDYLPRNLKCLTIDGRLQQIAIQHGGKSEINLASVLMKRLTIAGTTLRPRDDEFKAKITQQLFAKVWPLLESGQIKPIIDSVFPLANAAEAHERMESGQHIGKIILEV
ncbi:NAD(P)H-quinone oxidoreductase [Methylomonas sp. LW13]|uniref:NAD(P)H-quinone oxidoreductase n=1 Tax=unclassified Methylomonas TaxID=2608980 RepID=UPI00051AF946|nr:NAD(P)H-quinone oxidoreductase [Methylomonas sp. LW13]QBC26839.1 NAD(P)H-quinone oxidoreductase [Methylomonas sp. LW13]